MNGVWISEFAVKSTSQLQDDLNNKNEKQNNAGIQRYHREAIFRLGAVESKLSGYKGSVDKHHYDESFSNCGVPLFFLHIYFHYNQ